MKLRYIILMIVLINTILMAGLGVVSAQEAPDRTKASPIDSYPLPAQTGAVRYTLVDRWDYKDLTFYIHNCPSTISCSVAHDAIRAAFRAWDDVSGLSFSEVNSASNADIELEWSSTEDEFGYEGDTLAFAYFPSDGGNVYFDDAEYWTVYDGGDTDLYAVATHEIGHALGMDHTDRTDAIMYAFSGYAADLGQDDIAGIQQLYGADEGGSDDPVIVVEPPSQVPTGETEVVESTLDEDIDYEMWIIDVTAGETVTLTMETTRGDLDAYLALLTPDGEQVLAEDDDSMGGTDAQITYTFPTTGDYTIIATRYESSDSFTTGSYRLTAIRQGTTVQPPTNSPALPDDNQPAGGGWVDLTIYNNSGAELCGVWFTPSDSDDWGEEQLEISLGDYLYDGYYFTWQVEASSYDVWVEDCDENYLEQYYIDIKRDTEIEVQFDTFIIR